MTVFDEVLCKNASSTLTDVDLTNFFILRQCKSQHFRKMKKDNHIRDGNFQTGYAQNRDKVAFLKCKFCHKMIKKVEFAEHVMISHLGNERVINESLNEIVKDQYQRKKESGTNRPLGSVKNN